MVNYKNSGLIVLLATLSSSPVRHKNCISHQMLPCISVRSISEDANGPAAQIQKEFTEETELGECGFFFSLTEVCLLLGVCSQREPRQCAGCWKWFRCSVTQWLGHHLCTCTNMQAGRTQLSKSTVILYLTGKHRSAVQHGRVFGQNTRLITPVIGEVISFCFTDLKLCSTSKMKPL